MIMPSSEYVEEYVYEAIERGDVKSIAAILDLGFDVDTMYLQNADGIDEYNNMTLLHMAVDCDNYEVAEFLVDNGADVNIKDSYGMTPVINAMRWGYEEIAEMLLTSSSSSSSTFSAEVMVENLCWAVRELRPSLVDIILDKYPQTDVNRFDEQGMTPLHHAAVIDNNIDNLEERLTIVDRLLRAGAVDCKTKFDKTIGGRSNGYALNFAVENGNAEIVEALLNHGTDVNCRADSGLTPIIACASIGNLRIAEILLGSWSADTNLRLETNGMAPVHFACEFGHLDVLRYLHEVGDVNLNARDSYKSTPLHIATENGHSAIVQLLLEFGADVNAKDISGKTALHLAAHYSSFEIVKILLENGADTHARCIKSKLPIDYAEYDEKSRLVETIEKYHRESTRMMSNRIEDSRVTLNDIRTHNMHKRLIYSRNECIGNRIKSDNFRAEYPLYGEFVERRFKEAQQKNDMLLPALAALDSLTGNKLPTEINDIILDYLVNKDIKNLVESVKK